MSNPPNYKLKANKKNSLMSHNTITSHPVPLPNKQSPTNKQKIHLRKSSNWFSSLNFNEGVELDHETQSQKQCYKQYLNQIDNQQSIDPSSEDFILNGYIHGLKQQIQLKSEALTQAQHFIIILEQEIATVKQNIRQLQDKLHETEKKNQELQSQLEGLKQRKIDSSRNKLGNPIRTYLTEKQSSLCSPADSLKMISHQIFNEFVNNFDSLINQLSEWTNKQMEYETDSNILAKLELQTTEVSDLLYGIYDQTNCNGSTFQTSLPDSAARTSNPSMLTTYQQVISMYRQYCNSLSIMLCQSMSCIQQLTKNSSNLCNMYTSMTEPHLLIPNALIEIIVHDCKMIVGGMFSKLKMENTEIFEMANKMSEWITKNAKDRSFFINHRARKN